jgi:hypothetical protein
MRIEMSHQQAIHAFDHLERIAMIFPLDLIAFAPSIHKIGKELRSTAERQRMIDMIRSLRKKGFAVSEFMEGEMQLTWSNIDRAP